MNRPQTAAALALAELARNNSDLADASITVGTVGTLTVVVAGSTDQAVINAVHQWHDALQDPTDAHPYVFHGSRLFGCRGHYQGVPVTVRAHLYQAELQPVRSSR